LGKLIDGKTIAKKLRENLKKEVIDLVERGITPGLAVILVGDDPASKTYVRNKEKACREVGIFSQVFTYDATVSEQTLLNKIAELNEDPVFHGILVQLPLPKHIDEMKIIYAIDRKKDVDGFHPYNIGNLSLGKETFVPCTPKGVMYLLKEIGYSLSGKNAVVVGRSNIVGKPMGMLLLNADCTVTYCHSKTENLAAITKNADVLVSAVGKARLIGKDHVKEGAVVIDCGINRDEKGRLCGDVDFEEVLDRVSYITPVPGGVGPMTVTMLLANTIEAAKKFAMNKGSA